MNTQKPEETGVTDVRRAREAIAKKHDGNLAEHIAESNRIADDLRESFASAQSCTHRLDELQDQVRKDSVCHCNEENENSLDEELARPILRAILSCTRGQVGYFVDLQELSAVSAFGHAVKGRRLTNCWRRRWIYRRGDYVAVSRPGVECAIDWTLADRILEAIITIAGSQAGRVVAYSQVIAAAGLGTDKTDELMAELTVLGLAAQTTLDGSRIWPVRLLSREGLSRLSGRRPVGRD